MRVLVYLPLSLFLFRVHDRVMRARQLARRNLQDRVCDHHRHTTDNKSPFSLSLEAINFLVEINQEEKNTCRACADGQYSDPMVDGNVTAGRNRPT